MKHPYLTESYAKGFAPSMQPYHLPTSDSWMLKRAIPGTAYYDIMGCYPVSPLTDLTHLRADYEKLRSEQIVSLVLVSDVFTPHSEEEMHDTFDVVRAYKAHYLYDFSQAGDYTKHHRLRVRRARQLCDVRVISLVDYLTEWKAIYHHLVDKHHLTGLHDFSDTYFRALAHSEGLTMFGAFIEEELVAAHIWIEHRGYVYSHLAASGPKGYKYRCPYALYDTSIQYFREKNCKAIDFGGGAGVDSASDGLVFFKQGFANAEERCYFCGKIVMPDVYAELSKGKKEGSFFPIYRQV